MRSPTKPKKAENLSNQKTQGGIYADSKLSAAAKPYKLTGREIQVLTLCASGESCKAIAGQLEISTRTVDFHRQHICQKIGRPTLAAAIFRLFFFELKPVSLRNS